MKRSMVRRIALAGAALAVPSLLVGVLSAGAATTATTKVTFTGTITCKVKGSLTASPPITLSSASHTLKLHATLSGCKGSTKEKGVTITGGTLNATATATASCTSLSGGAPAGTITWKAKTPGATATKQAFSSAAIGVNSSSGVITVSLPGSSGTATSTGSFAGSTSKATAVVDQTESSLAGECLGSGVSKLTFTGTNGASSITVG
jgi:hypothetical protein